MKIKYRGGYKYQLLEDASIPVNLRDCNVANWIVIKDQELTVQRGYAWDGPSGPTIDTENFMRGSLFHDALYQLIRENRLGKQYRLYADEVLRDVCLQDGMSWIRAQWVYYAVRWFGGAHVK